MAADVVALRLMLPVVGCRVLYVLRFAGGPEGNMPRTFCWAPPVDNNDYIRKQVYVFWVHKVKHIKDREVMLQGSYVI